MATIPNPEHLITIGGQFTGAVAEYVDMEEDEAVAAERRQQVVQLLADIIDGDVPKACADGAKEAYEDVTGEVWSGIDAAEDYLREQYDYEGRRRTRVRRRATPPNRNPNRKRLRTASTDSRFMI